MGVFRRHHIIVTWLAGLLVEPAQNTPVPDVASGVGVSRHARIAFPMRALECTAATDVSAVTETGAADLRGPVFGRPYDAVGGVDGIGLQKP